MATFHLSSTTRAQPPAVASTHLFLGLMQIDFWLMVIMFFIYLYLGICFTVLSFGNYGSKQKKFCGKRNKLKLKLQYIFKMFGARPNLFN